MLEPKPLFTERLKKLMPDVDDFAKFLEIVKTKPVESLRANTLKISPEDLKVKLEAKGWKILQPFSSNPEIFVIDSKLLPGEIGKAKEHLLGYYYVQEISSMMPILALDPQPGDLILDLAAAPGSKTTQCSARMQNQGTIIANDKDLGRTSILSANLERCGCSNVIMTRHDGVQLCYRLERTGIKFDKILLDVPCSGEGNIRSNPKTYLMWNINMIRKLSRLQKKLVGSAVNLLKQGGVLVYSTCTHSPEENEEVVSFLLENFDLEIEKSNIPLKCRNGISFWEGKEFNVKDACRIYPQDNNTEGFFLCRMRKK